MNSRVITSKYKNLGQPGVAYKATHLLVLVIQFIATLHSFLSSLQAHTLVIILFFFSSPITMDASKDSPNESSTKPTTSKGPQKLTNLKVSRSITIKDVFHSDLYKPPKV